MSQLPTGLPPKLNSVLDLIDYKVDLNKDSNLFYFALYSEEKMKGWDTAEKDLEANLNRILEILKKDEYITDRDKKIQKLTKNHNFLRTAI